MHKHQGIPFLNTLSTSFGKNLQIILAEHSIVRHLMVQFEYSEFERLSDQSKAEIITVASRNRETAVRRISQTDKKPIIFHIRLAAFCLI